MKTYFCYGYKLNQGKIERTTGLYMSTLLFLRIKAGALIEIKNQDYCYAYAFYSSEIPEEYIYSYRYQEEQQWTTWIEGESQEAYTDQNHEFSKAGYIRLSIMRKDGAELTATEIENASNLLRIDGIDEKYDINASEEYITREDVQKEIQKTIRTIQDKRNPKSLVFTLLSDTHYVVNGNWENTAAAIEAVNTAVQPDGVIHLGDLTDGMLSGALCKYYSDIVLKRIQNWRRPLYLTIGNHDTNYFHNNPERFTEQEQYDFYLKNRVAGQLSENQLWYHKDYAEQKLRILFLHSFDASEALRYGFPPEEIEWMDEKLDTVPEDYYVLIYSHDAPIARLDYWAKEIRNGELLLAHLERWHSEHGERIMAYIHGHTHADYIYEERLFPIISIGCSKCEYFTGMKPEGATAYYRDTDSVLQTLWDTIIINTEKQQIDIVRFGAGEDRSLLNGTTINKQFHTKIWAHRGASGYAPENTLEAFQMAIDLQADGVELDVQFTKDRQLVVLHDERIDRTSNGSGYVEDFTLEELKQLCFNRTHPEFENAKIPTLQEVLELLRPMSMTINIELKTGVRFYPGIEQAVIRLVEGMQMEGRVIYSSFNHESVMRVQRLRPDAKVGLLYCDGINNVVQYAKSCKVDAIHPSLNNMKYPMLVEQCREQGIKLHVWTVNAGVDMKQMAEMGVDAIITNYPDVARRENL